MRFFLMAFCAAVLSGLSGMASAQGSTYDSLLNFSLMEQSRCSGRGGSWTGMTCSGGSAGSGGFTREDLEAIQNAIGAWHQSEMRKATCLMIVDVERTPALMSQALSAHVADFRPREIHIFREVNNRYHRDGTGPLVLTHGYTRMLIGHSLQQRIRRGEIPRTASCKNIDYAEKYFKLVASGVQTGGAGQPVRYELTGDPGLIAALVSR
ncbi:hypothetical protein [uncultured Roseobacter sp.]|uniref:hypothetical protein n=1 Tax=uncultured Roseobacter sp. TaxID=114847 RepID=UPI00261A6970|nr:hypothetical protein [uncultured Roseobacter sp.]